MLRGSGTYLIEGQQIPLRGGSLIWLFPGDAHCLVDTSPDYVQHIIVWRPRLVRCWATGGAAPLRRQHHGGIGCRNLTVARSRVLATCVETCAEVSAESTTPAHCSDEAESGLAWLLQLLWREWQAAGGDVGGHALHPAVTLALHVLRDPEIGRAATVASIARRAELSSDHMGRLFREQVGCTPAAFRNRVCLERYLANDAVQGDRLAAALAAGFGSYAQFYRVYREFIGSPPARSRRVSSKIR